MELLQFDSLEAMVFPKLMKIYREGNTENISYFFPEETDLRAGLHKVEEKFYDYLKEDFYEKTGTCYFVLEDDGEWVSAVRLFPAVGDIRSFYAEALETAPEYRKRGYAKKLMELLFAKLSEAGPFEITDTVNKRNEASIRLHQKCGFEVYKDPAVCVLNGKIIEKAYTMRFVSA